MIEFDFLFDSHLHPTLDSNFPNYRGGCLLLVVLPPRRARGPIKSSEYLPPIYQKYKKSTAPGVPRRSPIQVLSRPDDA